MTIIRPRTPSFWRPRTPSFWPGQSSLALPIFVRWWQMMAPWNRNTKVFFVFCHLAVFEGITKIIVQPRVNRWYQGMLTNNSIIYLLVCLCFRVWLMVSLHALDASLQTSLHRIHHKLSYVDSYISTTHGSLCSPFILVRRYHYIGGNKKVLLT